MRKIFVTCAFIALLLPSVNVFADDEQPKIKPPVIQLKYIREDSSQFAGIRVFSKKGKEFIPLVNEKVNIYLTDVGDQNLVAVGTTDEKGMAKIPLNKKFNDALKALGKHQFTLVSCLASKCDDIRSDIDVQDAVLKISLFEEDSVRKMKAALMAYDENNNLKPVPETEIHFYVKKLFSLQPVKEEAVSTDTLGEAIVEFPAGLRGNENGQLTTVVKIEDNDTYGTLQTSQKTAWGVAFIPKQSEHRLLSASRSNAPIPLIIISSSIVLGVWGVILYIVLQLFKIRKRRTV